MKAVAKSQNPPLYLCLFHRLKNLPKEEEGIIIPTTRAGRKKFQENKPA